jgi:hypothetical protein
MSDAPSDILTSAHFVRPDKLATFSEQTPLQTVFAELGSQEGAAFVLLASTGRPKALVNAHALATTALDAHGNDLQAVLKMPVGTLLGAATSVPVHAEDVKIGAATVQSLQAAPDTVFRIAGEVGTVGWFLNHETVLEVLTPKPVFLCTGPKRHRNTDPDSGRCSFCPFKLELSSEP